MASEYREVEEPANLQFPWKLHVMLTEAEQKNFQDTISWLPNGMAFKVHNKKKFAELIMPKYFASNKFKSFQRNLNLWGFSTHTKEPIRGTIYHPLFLRGQPEKCHMMKRIKIKKGASVHAKLSEASTVPSEAVISAVKQGGTANSTFNGPLNALIHQGAHGASFNAPTNLVHAMFPGLAVVGSSSSDTSNSTMAAAPQALLLALLQSQQKTQNPLDSLMMQSQADIFSQQVAQASANMNALQRLQTSIMVANAINAGGAIEKEQLNIRAMGALNAVSLPDSPRTRAGAAHNA